MAATVCDTFAQEAKHRISLQEPTDTTSDYGGASRAFSEVQKVWSIVTPMSGSQVFAQQANQTRVTHKFLIRYQAAYSDPKTLSDWRIVLDGKNFGIKYSRNLDLDRKNYGKAFIEIYAEENGADA